MDDVDDLVLDNIIRLCTAESRGRLACVCQRYKQAVRRVDRMHGATVVVKEYTYHQSTAAQAARTRYDKLTSSQTCQDQRQHPRTARHQTSAPQKTRNGASDQVLLPNRPVSNVTAQPHSSHFPVV